MKTKDRHPSLRTDSNNPLKKFIVRNFCSRRRIERFQRRCKICGPTPISTPVTSRRLCLKFTRKLMGLMTLWREQRISKALREQRQRRRSLKPNRPSGQHHSLHFSFHVSKRNYFALYRHFLCRCCRRCYAFNQHCFR